MKRSALVNMLVWIRIAVRNLFRNGRHSLFTILAVGLGFAAINVFGGFTNYVFSNLEEGFIYAQGNGHLSIFKKGFLENGTIDPYAYLLNEHEIKTIQEISKGLTEVVLVTGQLRISGLLSNGDMSTIFVAVGRVPSDVRTILSHASGVIRKVKLFTGKPLEDGVEYGVGLSSGLARKLGLDIGSDAIAVAPTINGQMNALDAKVFQIFESLDEALNDKLMVVPLAFAQSLYDTTSVDRLIVLLKDASLMGTVKGKLERTLKQKGLDIEIKTWKELSPFYSRVEEMFDTIFLFIFVIVFIIVIMSVINTISMAVVERTREIGTLRAMGTKRRGIVSLFAIESALLGIFGSFLGIILTFIAWLSIKMAGLTWIPPHITKRIPLEIYIVPKYMVVSLVFLVVLSIGAAIMPARRAAFKSIVDALGHV